MADQKVYITDMDATMAATGVHKTAHGGTDLPASTMVQVDRLALPQAR